MSLKTNPKRAAAIELLVSSGYWPENYVPVGLRFLWRLGLNLPPPIFVNFWPNTLMAGGVMTVVYLIFFSLFMGGLHSLQYLILLSLGLGASVGLSQGGNFSRLRRKYNLPTWDEIDGPL